ncbi:MAG: S41 family peptidase [Candidatus Delongbacteria bacterium]
MNSLSLRALAGVAALTLLLGRAGSVHAAPADESGPATWYRYPALSPDGQWIAFSALGDLWLVPALGGTARPLTRDVNLETKPVWSPDGQWLAFASDRHGNFDLFVMPAQGGAERRLTTHSAGDYPWAFSEDGARLIYSSGRMGLPASRLYPAGWPGEVYSVELATGATRSETLLAAEEISVGPQGWLYERVISVEDEFRKHHVSSAARELWLRRPDGSHEQVTNWAGEDREPVWRPGGGFWFISERDSCLNVFAGEPGGAVRQLTHHKTEPVRGLSASRDGLLCYSQAGALWTLREGGKPRRLAVELRADRRAAHPATLPLAGEASEALLSPDGRELAFIAHGEVFVCSVEHGTTRRLTDTPEQERNLAFAPDGRSLAYAGERANCWRLYRATLPRKQDLHFFNAAQVVEETLVDGPDDCFQPRFSPDGTELAFLAKRTELRVLNLKTKQTRVVLPERLNYSYADGDQAYEWSPDGQWFTFHFPDKGRWSSELGVVPAAGGPWHNLSQSGFEDYNPRWTANGKGILYQTDRQGMKSQGGWGGQEDVYLLAPSREGLEWFRLSEEELAARQEADSLAEVEKEEAPQGKKGRKAKPEPEEAEEDSVHVTVELPDADRRILRLTTASAVLADYLLSKDCETLYTLAAYTKGFDLYETKLRKHETRLLGALELDHGAFVGATDEALFLLAAGGRLLKFDLAEEAPEDVACEPEMTLRQDREWEYQFDHIWRQVREKFYSPGLHGVDWNGLRATYRRYLPAIDHPRDFAECMSELLGELNASHTGCFVSWRPEDGDATADLGLLFDPAWTGTGWRVAEVLPLGPCDRSDSRVRAGHTLLAVNGRPLDATEESWLALNRRAGQQVLLSLRDEKGVAYEQTVTAVASGARQRLLYERWVRRNADEVERLSQGRLGYVHVESMDGGSYRRLVHEALGRLADREALVVDSRHNGGGNLTNQLITFLGGRRIFRNVVRPDQHVIGEDPWQHWLRPSIVLMNEANYSDAHCFPFAYKDSQLGQLVGMPVAGTGTSVWWEGLMGGRLVFGIPEVGLMDEQGTFLENHQLEPDIRVDNTPGTVSTGQDLQLQAAVAALLRELGPTKQP